MTVITEHSPGLVLRGVTSPLRLADFRLIAFDMDSTLINISASTRSPSARKAEVAAITEATMRGEIKDFKESLRPARRPARGRAGDPALCNGCMTNACA